MNKLKLVEKTQMHDEFPKFVPGDTINVAYRVREGEKERIQNYEGVVIAQRGSGANRTFTVRKISNGVGVERIFLYSTPYISDISIKRRGKVRRAKLYYLRDLRGKKARLKERETKR